jgi:hypothetical protein
LDSDALEFGTYGIGASGVTTVSDAYFVSQFEREYWVQVLDNRGQITSRILVDLAAVRLLCSEVLDSILLV